VTVDRVDAARVGDTKVAAVGHADERTASAARAATAAASKRARHAEKQAIAAAATVPTASASFAVKDMLAHSTRVHWWLGSKATRPAVQEEGMPVRWLPQPSPQPLPPQLLQALL